MTTELQAPGTSQTVPFESCEHCEAPVETTQRYCVVCGTRRRHVPDPAARFLSQAASRSRSTTHVVQSASSRRRRRGPGLGTALVLAVIPVALGVGVVLGRGSTDNAGKLLAAIRAQKPAIVNVTGGGGGAAPVAAGASNSVQSGGTVTSDFPLQSGYAVELGTVPSSSAPSAVSAAEKAAEAKGAGKVGVVLSSDYAITPAPKDGADVIYAGAYKTRAEAEKALAELRPRFPQAAVISLRSTASSSPAGTGKVLAKTQYGTATQVTGFQATKGSLAQGEQVANKVAKTIGKNYVSAQTGLPSQVSVP